MDAPLAKTTTRGRHLLRVNKEVHEGPNPLWVTIIALANIVIFAGLGYLLWEALGLPNE